MAALDCRSVQCSAAPRRRTGYAAVWSVRLEVLWRWRATEALFLGAGPQLHLNIVQATVLERLYPVEYVDRTLLGSRYLAVFEIGGAVPRSRLLEISFQIGAGIALVARHILPDVEALLAMSVFLPE